MSSDKCFDGWAEEDGNRSGRCCCNCMYQKKIVGHPWNKNKAHKTNVTETIGWGCNMEDADAIVFFEKKHGMCEVHNWKYSQDVADQQQLFD